MMLEFYFEYLRATGELTTVTCEVHYEEALDLETDYPSYNVNGVDILGVSDEEGVEIVLAPGEQEDVLIQAEDEALKALLGSRRSDVAKWIA